MNTIRSAILKFLSGLRSCEKPYSHMRDLFFRFTKRDPQWIIILVLLGVLTRFPALNHPNEAQFDETIYANYASHMIDGIPPFDIHPPLVRMMFAEVARLNEPFETRAFSFSSPNIFHDFPYFPLRILVAVFGVILPIIIYGSGRVLGYSPRISGLISLFVIFDSAFTLYSRVILPDTILLCFEFFAILSAFMAMKQIGNIKFVFFTMSALALGCAVSIKWTSLAVLATVCLLYSLRREIKAIFFTVSVVAVMYAGIFFVSLHYYPKGGSVDPIIPAYDVPWISHTYFPANPDFTESTSFFVEWHKVILSANKDQQINSEILQAPRPLSWAVAKSSITFWMDSAGHKIVLQGNSILWVVSLFLLLFEVAWIGLKMLKNFKWPIGQNETILLAGYAMNYLPFFFISRPMYLYHYFTALIFLFLLAPRIVTRVNECIVQVTRDRLFAQTFLYAVVGLIFVTFFSTMRTTYGF